MEDKINLSFRILNKIYLFIYLYRNVSIFSHTSIQATPFLKMKHPLPSHSNVLYYCFVH